MYIRFAKGGDPVVKPRRRALRSAPRSRRARGARIAIMATGVMTTNCLAAALDLARHGPTPAWCISSTISSRSTAAAVLEFAR